MIELAKSQGINVEVRPVKVAEIVEAAENGSLKEMFGAGTAAVISPISGFTHKEKAFDLPKMEDSYATKLKKQLTELQANRAEDPFGWRYEVPAIEV